jgi:HEPN domain-containing protein
MKSGHDHARILIEKAGNDLKVVEIGLAHGAPTDTVAFHLQQAAEKMLKALLASRTIVYPKTVPSSPPMVHGQVQRT